ncbi:MAG: RHS repeat-associated core domain-containing protein, partial [Candidatus Eremiobacteraeota bacterium]|nr:RHS repeat-associated core domain-containing protein [Candidatus Eremiobacteraeota bacterium]
MRSLYDAEGIRRLSKDDNGDQSKFFSSGGMSLADQRPGGPVSFMQGHQLLGLEQGGDFHFYITDGLGSVRLVVDETATVEGAFDHDVWGVPDTSVMPPGAELGAHSFVGALGQRNEGDGIYYARQRWYDANIGRWLSQDPIGLTGGLNLFGYTGQNPVIGVDPSGLDWVLYTTESHWGEHFTNVWDFYATLKSRVDHGAKVSKIDFDKGHGNCGMQGITEGITQRSRSSPPGGIYTDYSKTVPTVTIKVRDMPGHSGEEFSYDLIELLKDHLTSDAVINFRGCATADKEASLVALTSILLPDVTVSGPTGSYHPYRPFWKGEVATYRGGKIQPNGHFR